MTLVCTWAKRAINWQRAKTYFPVSHLSAEVSADEGHAACEVEEQCWATSHSWDLNLKLFSKTIILVLETSMEGNRLWIDARSIGKRLGSHQNNEKVSLKIAWELMIWEISIFYKSTKKWSSLSIIVLKTMHSARKSMSQILTGYDWVGLGKILKASAPTLPCADHLSSRTVKITEALVLA